MRDTTPVALAVIKSQSTDPPSIINLAEDFQRLQHEYDDICGEKCEQAIQSKLLEQRKVFIRHLESMFSEINDNSNRKIRETNAKFGLTLPLEGSRKVSALDVAEHDRRFITAERGRIAVQKKHLKERLEEIKLEISSALGFIVTADLSSLPHPTESPDDTVKIAQLLEDKLSLQNSLEVSKQTVIKLEAEKKQDETTIARCHSLHQEARQENNTLREELEQLKKKIQHYEVVASAFSRVLHGSSHAARCYRDDDGFHNIKGRPPADRNVIDARNDTCHKGDIAAEYSLFLIDPDRTGWNIGGERYLDFTKSYCLTPHQFAKIYSVAEERLDQVLLEVLNLHSTMYRCYFNTEHTHSRENDKAFNVLFAKLLDKYKFLLASENLSQAGDRYRLLVIFVKQASNDWRKMREIVGKTVEREKARRFKQVRLITQSRL